MSEQIGPVQEPESNPSQLSQDLERITRTNRNLETYKRVFGQELGRGEELILDVGAGDATVAEEIAALGDHRATVIRLDPDYANTPAQGDQPAVTADAANMPFADGTFDRITSFWVLPHLGPEKGTAVMAEVLRVLKPDGQALLFPARPFKKVEADFADKEVNGPLIKQIFPSLRITKPADYDSWSSEKKEEAASELAGYLTYGGPLFKVMKFGFAKAIEITGSKRSLDKAGNEDNKIQDNQ